MKSSIQLFFCVPVFAFASLSVRGFSAGDDFSHYSTPAKFSSRAVTDVAGAGDPGTGAKGNGWLNGWRSASTSVIPTVTIINTRPLAFGGNYLSAVLAAHGSATGTADAIAIGRAYDASGASLASAGPIQIGFEFRADDIATDTLRLDLFESGFRASSSTANGSTYCFRTIGGYWHYFDGINLQSTGMAFKVGVTYTFSITLNPGACVYAFTISDQSGSVAISDAAFRARNFDTDPAAGTTGGRWLQFGVAETTDVAGQAATISIDNLFITAKPHPTPSATR